MLLIAFAAAVRTFAGQRRGLRRAGNCLAAVGLVGLVLTFFPMHMRGSEPSFTDTMHVILGGVNLLFLLLAIGFATTAFGKRFRLYSAATILIMLLMGAWTGILAPAIPANLPTPHLGLVERALFGAFLLWIAVLSVALFRSDPADQPRTLIRSGQQGSPASADGEE